MVRYEIQLATEDEGSTPSGEVVAPLGEAALEAIRRAAWHEPTDPDFHFILGTALAREGRLEQARVAFREACAGSPNDSTYRRALGECDWRLGRYEAASDSFRDVLGRSPDDDEAANGLALSLLRMGRATEAADVLRPVATRNAARPDWHSNLAAALWESGQLPEAERRYRHAVRMAPQEPAYKRNLARLLLEQGKAEEAVRWLRAALDQAPDEAPAWISLGDAQLALQRRAEAEAAYEKGVGIDATAMTSRPQSRAAWEALRLEAAWEDLGHDGPPRGSGRSRSPFSVGWAVARVVSAFGTSWRGRLRGALLAATLVTVAWAAAVLLPPYITHHKLHDDVVREARAATKDEARVRGGVAAALRRHGLEGAVPAEAVHINSGERWRVVEFRYAVSVDLLPGLPVSLSFRIRVDEPFLAEPDPIFL